jgi:hypothetical protein
MFSVGWHAQHKTTSEKNTTENAFIIMCDWLMYLYTEIYRIDLMLHSIYHVWLSQS